MILEANDMAEIIFHGSNVEVAEPKILQHGFYKDFGYGFYCTNTKNRQSVGLFQEEENLF